MNSPAKVRIVQRPLGLLFRRIFPAIGSVGLVITVVTNLVALQFFKKTAAEFLSHGWWSTWFPSYLVWVAFLVMSLVGVVMKTE